MTAHSARIRAAFAEGRLTRTDLQKVVRRTSGSSQALKKVSSALQLPQKDLVQELGAIRSLAATLLAEPHAAETAHAAVTQRHRAENLGFRAEEPEFSTVAGKPPLRPLMGFPDARQTEAVRKLLDDSMLRSLREGLKSDAVVAGQHYAPTRGGPITLKGGAVVEGSIDFGGIQPHYVIDMSHPALAKLYRAAMKIGERHRDVFTKVNEVVKLVRHTLTDGDYDAPKYIELLREARGEKRNVSLGEYIDVHAGVCRENALLTHVLLQAAGIETHYAYCRATAGHRHEGHAVCLMPVGDRTWVVDSYNSEFHGADLADAMKAGGTAAGDVRMPKSGHPKREYGYSLALAPYPVVWNPVP